MRPFPVGTLFDPEKRLPLSGVFLQSLPFFRLRHHHSKLLPLWQARLQPHHDPPTLQQSLPQGFLQPEGLLHPAMLLVLPLPAALAFPVEAKRVFCALLLGWYALYHLHLPGEQHWFPCVSTQPCGCHAPRANSPIAWTCLARLNPLQDHVYEYLRPVIARAKH